MLTPALGSVTCLISIISLRLTWFRAPDSWGRGGGGQEGGGGGGGRRRRRKGGGGRGGGARGEGGGEGQKEAIRRERMKKYYSIKSLNPPLSLSSQYCKHAHTKTNILVPPTTDVVPLNIYVSKQAMQCVATVRRCGS